MSYCRFRAVYVRLGGYSPDLGTDWRACKRQHQRVSLVTAHKSSELPCSHVLRNNPS
jgi:hypothetical protein